MKKLCCTCAALLCIATTIVFAAETMYQSKTNAVQIGAEVLQFENDLYNINDKTYVPVRELADYLKIPIDWDSNSEMVSLDTNHKQVHVPEKTEYKPEGVIPDEETAYQVGKIILETYAGKSLEYETDEKVYYLAVRYQEEFNSWYIEQTFDYKDGRGWGAVGIYVPAVILNKNTGEVVSINTYSELD